MSGGRGPEGVWFEQVFVTSDLCRQLEDADKVSVFLRDSDGRTGLHHAALLGRVGLLSWDINSDLKEH